MSWLQRRASRRPEEPWLFFRDGLDWRWRSWSAMVRRAEAFASHLAAAGLAGAVPRHAVALDPFQIALAFAGELRREAGAARDGSRRWASPGTTEDDLVLDPEADAELRQSRPLDLAPAAVDEVLAALPGAAGRRDIVVVGEPLPSPVTVGVLRWSLATGAAVVLAEAPEVLLPTALWARPTVFFGRSSEVDGLAAGLTRRPRRRDPLGRLRLVVCGAEELASGDLWRQQEIALVAAPW